MTRQKKLKVKLEAQEDLVPVTTDPGKVRQILYNFLSNAVKFTDPKGQITIKAAMIDDNTVRISVIDTGIGLKQKDAERIFKSFEQVENSASRKYPGTGLGLSLCKRFVELHGGKIWAESRGEGKGSAFHILIPESRIPNKRGT